MREESSSLRHDFGGAQHRASGRGMEEKRRSRATKGKTRRSGAADLGNHVAAEKAQVTGLVYARCLRLTAGCIICISPSILLVADAMYSLCDDTVCHTGV